MAGADWPERMAREYRASGDTRFEVVDDPARAEMIIFWEPFQASQETWAQRLREHPLVKAFPEKVYIVSPEDRPLGFLRGLYCSLPRRLFDPRRHRTWIYQGTLNPYIETAARASRAMRPVRLAAFVGAPSHAVRREMFARKEALGSQGILISETRNSQFNADPANADHREQQLRYIDVILGSKFSLCPRGTGTGSFRLQESMALGRAPVIISDEWVPIEGPSWSRCAIFVPERKVGKLGEILRQYEPRWREMGSAAREEWEAYFEPAAYACNALLQLEAIHRTPSSPESAFHAQWGQIITRERRRQNPLLRRAVRRFARMAHL
jgi:Exostosin family